jgi:hypothetical protein
MDEPKIGGRNGGQVSAGIQRDRRIRACRNADSIRPRSGRRSDQEEFRKPSGMVMQINLDRQMGWLGHTQIEKRHCRMTIAKDMQPVDRPRVVAKPRLQTGREFLNAKDKFKT